jgi:predicted NAD-dependent protein-ADP-ribosyltransferase YbiA (DUF1768 family)
MVLSKINKSISYPEIKSVDLNDLKKQVDTFKLNLREKYGIEILIAVGSHKNTYEEFNVTFFPIYLVKYNNKVIQIGVYEIPSSLMISLMDDDEIDKEKLTNPLFYTFVTKEYLSKYRLKPDEDSDSNAEIKKDSNKNSNQDDITILKTLNSSENLIPDIRKDIFVITDGFVLPPLLTEEKSSTSKEERNIYIEDSSDNWVQMYMKNKNYYIVDNEGDGDCLFATIRDAFSSIGQQTSVSKLRNKLSEEVNEQIFSDFKERYELFRINLLEETKKIKELAESYSDITSKFNNTLDRNEQKLLSESAKKIKNEHDNFVREKAITNQYLKEYRFMKGIDTVEKFKQEVRKCSFWAEEWSISVLERILNIKFILLSSENYQAGDIKNVLLCGDGDIMLHNQNVFNPDFYIINDYMGNHYKLIGYKKKKILKFTEIPYDIKRMIADKCMEKQSGLFDLIPDFKDFKARYNYNTEPQEIILEDYSKSKLKGLYDENTVFLFYSKSNSKPLPGKGAGEKIDNSDVSNYKKLATIKDWRKKLDNFWVEKTDENKIVPIIIDNHKWASVEHYYQASKFKKNNQEFYLSFSLDSGTELSKDPVLAKAAGGKSGKFKKELLRPKEVEMDPDFFRNIHKTEMAKAQSAKFTQIDSLKELLINTNNAKLTHHSRGIPPIIFEELMIIRENLKNQ